MLEKTGFRLCQLLVALQITSYGESVVSIARGDFDGTGLVDAMVRMEAVANGFSALGWGVVLALSFTQHLKAAGRICYILAGMMWFDVLTTWPLDMPLPPHFLIWGSIIVVLQSMIGWMIERQAALPFAPDGKGVNHG